MLISKTGDSEEESSALDSQACPHCGAAREFVLEQTPSPASYIISVCALFYFGIWSIFIIPLVVQSTKVLSALRLDDHQALLLLLSGDRKAQVLSAPRYQ